MPGVPPGRKGISEGFHGLCEVPPVKISRASFLKLLGGTIASLLLFGCRREKSPAKNDRDILSKPDISLWEKELELSRKRNLQMENLVRVPLPGKHPRFPEAHVRLGMAIDLDICDGCGKCALACMVENNVSRVSADEARKGRFMHWLEMRGNVPVMCAHCGDAPCERVCPTGAAVSSPDGFSAMVYPRCIGTRFCGANCPLHARKFNYADARSEGLAAKFNPEVPIRPRGVMEKCSLCIQRLQDARTVSRTFGSEWDGENVTTACAETCPRHAILFGNWLNPNSALVRSAQNRTVYAPESVAKLSPAVVYLRGRG